MIRSAGTHEGYQPATQQPAHIRATKPIWTALPTSRPWPLDVAEPVAWRLEEEEP